MAKPPKKVEPESTVKRTVPMPGWVYNVMIDAAQRDRRDVNAQIAVLLERIAAELKEKTPGNRAPIRTV